VDREKGEECFFLSSLLSASKGMSGKKREVNASEAWLSADSEVVNRGEVGSPAHHVQPAKLGGTNIVIQGNQEEKERRGQRAKNDFCIRVTRRVATKRREIKTSRGGEEKECRKSGRGESFPPRTTYFPFIEGRDHAKGLRTSPRACNNRTKTAETKERKPPKSGTN